MLMVGRALAFSVTFLVPVILVRVFSPVEFGTYKQFTLITSTLFAIGQLGLAECLFYFLPARPEAAGRYVTNSIIMLGAAGVVILGGLVLASATIANWLSNPGLAQYIPLIGVYLIFMLMGAPLEHTMISRHRYSWATATYFVSDLLRALLLVVPALVTRNLFWMFAGGVLFCLLRVIGTVAYFRTEFHGSLSFDKVRLSEQMSYALPLALSGVVLVMQGSYHQYAVSYAFDAATFAIYSVGCLQIPLVDFMATPAANVMMVRMTEKLREGQSGYLLPIWHDTTRKLALIFFPLTGLLFSNAYPLITLLFTRAYAASAPIFMVWSLSILASALQTDAVLRVFAQMRFIFATNLIRLAVIVALMGWFLTSFQLSGPVLITMIGILVAKVMALVRMRRVLNTTFMRLLPWGNLGGILIAALVAAIPSLLLNARLDLSPLYVLPVSGFLYLFTYGLLVITAGLLTETERAAIRRNLYVWNRWTHESRREAGL
jgi:O-antigen/teichoic acid export membrane protein